MFFCVQSAAVARNATFFTKEKFAQLQPESKAEYYTIVVPFVAHLTFEVFV